MNKEKSRQLKGQALVEFALVLPMLLVLILGIIDLSRLLIGYADAYNSIRSAARTAATIGAGGDAYRDCAEIGSIAADALFVEYETVNVTWLNFENPATNQEVCNYISSGAVNGSAGLVDPAWGLDTSDRIQIEAETRIRFINPFLTAIVNGIEFDLRAERTVLVNFEIDENAAISDTDYDGLNDDWEIDNIGDLSEGIYDDTDADGCNNLCEYISGSSASDDDSDNDESLDGEEFQNRTLLLVPDTDGDGLWDGEEVKGQVRNSGPFFLNTAAPGTANPTNPLEEDSDTDKLLDGEEVNTYGTDPQDTDTDDDNLSDYDEVITYGTNPLLLNSDTDLLNDYEEVITYGTNPLLADSDGDKLNDDVEVAGILYDTETVYTDPNKTDTDGDGFSDYEEYLGRYDDRNGNAPFPNIANPGDPNPTNPTSEDSDNDTLLDRTEIEVTNTDPTVADADNDGDGMVDTWEVRYFGDETIVDGTTTTGDADSCNALCEYTNGTDPTNADTDGDLLLDSEEINGVKETGANIGTTFTPSNPLVVDTDADGINDATEVNGYIVIDIGTVTSDPTLTDTDTDGLTDIAERDGTAILIGNNTTPTTVYSDPSVADTDTDGLLDGAEVNIHRTNPNNPDTDGDLLSDSYEVRTNVAAGNRYTTNPGKADSDNDGLNDKEEIDGLTLSSVAFNATNPNREDTDNDGLTDNEEVTHIEADGTAFTDGEMTDPIEDDSDGDFLLDGEEIDGWTVSVVGSSSYDVTSNPNDTDTDADGVGDRSERTNGTDPRNADTDGDTYSDRQERADGSDPLDPDEFGPQDGDDTTVDDGDGDSTTGSDLSMAATVDTRFPSYGGNVTFTATVTNDGPEDATGVSVEVALTGQLVYVSDDGTGTTVSGGVIAWPVGALASGDSVSLDIVATASGAGEMVTEVMTADQEDPDSIPGNRATADDDRATIDVSPSLPANTVELISSIEVSPENIRAQQTQVTTVMTVHNVGNVAASNVRIEATIPQQTREQSYSNNATGSSITQQSSNGNENETGINRTILIWQNVNIPAGGSVELTITAYWNIRGYPPNAANNAAGISYTQPLILDVLDASGNNTFPDYDITNNKEYLNVYVCDQNGTCP